jgi:hypothetical protein
VVLRVVSPLEVKRLTLRPASSPFWRSNARSLRIPSLTFIVVPVRLLSDVMTAAIADVAALEEGDRENVDE